MPSEAQRLAKGEGTTEGGSPPQDSNLYESRGFDPTEGVAPSTEVEGAIWMTNCWSFARGAAAATRGGCATAGGAKEAAPDSRASP
jgi:hypothetical protein